VFWNRNKYNNVATLNPLTSKNANQNPMTSENTIEHAIKRPDQIEHKEHVLSTLGLTQKEDAA
jgi:hypothetical protein